MKRVRYALAYRTEVYLAYDNVLRTVKVFNQHLVAYSPGGHTVNSVFVDKSERASVVCEVLAAFLVEERDDLHRCVVKGRADPVVLHDYIVIVVYITLLVFFTNGGYVVGSALFVKCVGRVAESGYVYLYRKGFIVVRPISCLIYKAFGRCYVSFSVRKLSAGGVE